MRKLIDDGPDCEPAVHMKGGLKAALGEQKSIDAPHAKRFDIGKQSGAAFATGDAGVPLQFPGRWIAANDGDCVGRIDGFRRIGAPVHRLTVVAVAEELHDRLGGDFNLNRAAAALDFGHSLSSDTQDAAFANTRAMRLRQSAPSR
jgi:hypothetical protein